MKARRQDGAGTIVGGSGDADRIDRVPTRSTPWADAASRRPSEPVLSPHAGGDGEGPARSEEHAPIVGGIVDQEQLPSPVRVGADED